MRRAIDCFVFDYMSVSPATCHYLTRWTQKVMCFFIVGKMAMVLNMYLVAVISSRHLLFDIALKYKS